MGATGLASRTEALAEHNNFTPRGAISDLLSTRKPKIQQTYSKRASKLSIQHTIPSQEHISIDTPSLDSLPPEDYALRAASPKKRSISSLDSTRVQRTASQPSVPSTELPSIGTSPRGSLRPQGHASRIPNPKKLSISDFFRPIPHNSRSSSPIQRHNLFSPIPSSPQTIPSSPPPLYSVDEKENYPTHKKRAVSMDHKENIPLKGNGSDGRKRKDEDGKKKVETNENENLDQESVIKDEEEDSEAGEEDDVDNYAIGAIGGIDGPGDRRPRKRRLLEFAKSKVVKKTKASVTKKPKLTQATLSMAAHGATVREPETCECTFLLKDFTAEEETEHKKFHDNHFKPVSVKGYHFSGEGCPSTATVGASGHMFSVISISCHHAAKWQTLAEKVITRVEVDVSGRKLEKDELWSETAIRDGINTPRFKILLAVKNNLVVSVVVLELIARARVVKMVPCDALGNTSVDDGAGRAMTEHKLEYTKRLSAATMGIHYMWTHEKYRKQGFAAALLDFARRRGFMAGYYAARGLVAFTDLTEAGKQFAARYLNETSVVGSEWEYLEYDSAA